MENTTHTILIPIDFQVSSLQTLKEALEMNKNIPLNIVLMYSEHLSDSISELLFYSPNKTIANLTTPEFTEALEIISNRFEGTVKNISIRIFHGANKNALTLFCEANGVQSIYIHARYKLNTLKRAFDPVPLIKKLRIPVIELGWEPTEPVHKKFTLMEKRNSLSSNSV